ncbi:MAG: ATP-grasp domain protein [Congregibacter sp.]
MRRCAFLTLEDPGDFFIYDSLLREPLGELGWDVEDVPWTRPAVDWSVYDAVIVRSTWDYQRAPDLFLQTLEAIESQTALYNPAAICRWNIHKGYLRDLEREGVSIVPTLWFDYLDEDKLRRAAQHFAGERLVTKPPIGANADDTYVIDPQDLATATAALTSFAQQAVMVQPFLPSIGEEGEYSLFFFGGEFSHAIRKRPKAGDFRVQEEHGGLIVSFVPPSAIVEFAERALAAVGETLLFARVDVVRLPDGALAIIEMELIEPSLYFEHCDDAAVHFARVFQRMHLDVSTQRDARAAP